MVDFFPLILFLTFPREHTVLLLRVSEGWCVLFGSIVSAKTGVLVSPAADYYPLRLQNNVPGISRYKYPPKQTKNTGLLSNCLHRKNFMHSSPFLICLPSNVFFPKQSRRMEEVENQTTTEEVG